MLAPRSTYICCIYIDERPLTLVLFFTSTPELLYFCVAPNQVEMNHAHGECRCDKLTPDLMGRYIVHFSTHRWQPLFSTCKF